MGGFLVMYNKTSAGSVGIKSFKAVKQLAGRDRVNGLRGLLTLTQNDVVLLLTVSVPQMIYINKAYLKKKQKQKPKKQQITGKQWANK